jgi:RNase P/RNase MRP subunit POP5
MAFGNVGLGNANPWLTTSEVEESRCVLLQEERHVFEQQVDGEPAGQLSLATGES